MYIIITLIVILLCYLLHLAMRTNEYFTIPFLAKQKTVKVPTVTNVTFYTLPNYTGNSSTANSSDSGKLLYTSSGIGSIVLPDGHIVKLTNVSGKIFYVYSSQPRMPQAFTGSCQYVIYTKQVLFFSEPKYEGIISTVDFGKSGQVSMTIGSIIIPDKYTVTLTSASGKSSVFTQSVKVMPSSITGTYTYAITKSS